MTYDRINLVLPTRKRVPHLAKFIESAVATAKNVDSLYLTVLVDGDDFDTTNYLIHNPPKIPLKVVWWDGVVPHLGEMYNVLYDYSSPALDVNTTVVSMVGDDMVFATPGWDERILREINARNGWAVVSLNDDYIQRGKIFVNVFTTRKIVEATGGSFMSEEFNMDFIDVVWTHLARLTGTDVYLPDVVLRHEHSSVAGDDTRERLRATRSLFTGGMRRALQIAEEYAPRVREAMARDGFTPTGVRNA